MNKLPETNQCQKCKQWFHTVHVCASDVNLMPVGCTTPSDCKQHGCHGACLPDVQAAQPAHAHAIDTSPERVEKQAGDVQVPNYREIADCVLAGLEDRKGVLNLDVDADIEEEIRQEVADNIRMMLYAAPSTKEQTE